MNGRDSSSSWEIWPEIEPSKGTVGRAFQLRLDTQRVNQSSTSTMANQKREFERAFWCSRYYQDRNDPFLQFQVVWSQMDAVSKNFQKEIRPANSLELCPALNSSQWPSEVILWFFSSNQKYCRINILWWLNIKSMTFDILMSCDILASSILKSRD